MTKDERLDARHGLAYRADYSARYHRRRATFLLVTDKLLSVAVIVAGTGAFFSLTASGPPIIAMAAALVVAIITTLQVVLDIGMAGAKHAEWMRRWDRLASDIRSIPLPTPDDLKEWDDTRAGIEGECVAELRGLAVACENDARTYMGTAEGIRTIKPLQRLLLHFGTYQTDFPVVKAEPPANAQPKD